MLQDLKILKAEFSSKNCFKDIESNSGGLFLFCFFFFYSKPSQSVTFYESIEINNTNSET